jgi:hypothetical protein
MQDDEYFDDEFELNEEALAALDREEQKYALSVTQNASHRSTPPPSKRLRTEHGWTPGQGNYPPDFEELDNLPEISVQGDGTYGLRGVNQAISSALQSWDRGLKMDPPPASLQFGSNSEDSLAIEPDSSTAPINHSTSISPRPAMSSKEGLVLSPNQQQTSATGPNYRSSRSQALQQVPLAASCVSAPVPSERYSAEIEAFRRQMEEV